MASSQLQFKTVKRHASKGRAAFTPRGFTCLAYDQPPPGVRGVSHEKLNPLYIKTPEGAIFLTRWRKKYFFGNGEMVTRTWIRKKRLRILGICEFQLTF